jgi:Zn-dependent peptidase ImmA (M78 family)
MSYLPRHEIEARADGLRQITGSQSIPVNVDRLAKTLDITVKYESLSADISGALMRKAGVAVIAINKDHSQTRKNFSLAHELGHYWLHQDDEVFLDKSIMHRDAKSARGDDWKEIQANQFAASLLMPKQALEKAFDGQLATTQDRDEIVKTLAKQFGVSARAMELRLMNLALIEVADE